MVNDTCPKCGAEMFRDEEVEAWVCQNDDCGIAVFDAPGRLEDDELGETPDMYEDDPRLPMLIEAFRAAVPLRARAALAYETTIGAITMAKTFLAMYDAMKAFERNQR